jgi:hypothetical protein
MQREDALDPDPCRDPAYREIGCRSRPMRPPDANALEGLYPLSGAFPDADVNPDRVSGAEFGNVFVDFWGNEFRCFHGRSKHCSEFCIDDEAAPLLH